MCRHTYSYCSTEAWNSRGWPGPPINSRQGQRNINHTFINFMYKTISTLNFLQVSMVYWRYLGPEVGTFVRQTIADERKRCDLAAQKVLREAVRFHIAKLNTPTPRPMGFPEGSP